MHDISTCLFQDQRAGTLEYLIIKIIASDKYLQGPIGLLHAINSIISVMVYGKPCPAVFTKCQFHGELALSFSHANSAESFNGQYFGVSCKQKHGSSTPLMGFTTLGQQHRTYFLHLHCTFIQLYSLRFVKHPFFHAQF